MRENCITVIGNLICGADTRNDRHLCYISVSLLKIAKLKGNILRHCRKHHLSRNVIIIFAFLYRFYLYLACSGNFHRTVLRNLSGSAVHTPNDRSVIRSAESLKLKAVAVFDCTRKTGNNKLVLCSLGYCYNNRSLIGNIVYGIVQHDFCRVFFGCIRSFVIAYSKVSEYSAVFIRCRNRKLLVCAVIYECCLSDYKINLQRFDFCRRTCACCRKPIVCSLCSGKRIRGKRNSSVTAVSRVKFSLADYLHKPGVRIQYIGYLYNRCLCRRSSVILFAVRLDFKSRNIYRRNICGCLYALGTERIVCFVTEPYIAYINNFLAAGIGIYHSSLCRCRNIVAVLDILKLNRNINAVFSVICSVCRSCRRS